MKKILFGLAAFALVIATVPMFAAFEAHVINVTATIENALQVSPSEISFGTTFPQERLDKTFEVSISNSFREEGRVDDVEYIIRQKPKCVLVATGTQLPPFGLVTENVDGIFSCADEVNYDMLPLLCPYLSKHEITTDSPENDSAGINAFHGLPGPWTLQTTKATQVAGKLMKSTGDVTDTWNIDLKVPCFAGSCAQDWAAFVHEQNPDADPVAYMADPALEHKLFGCDLWLEVNGVSRTPRGELSIKQSSDGEALAAWSTFDGQDGLLAHLRVAGTDGTNGDEARIVIQASEVGITTLDDLDTIEWKAFGVTGYAPHVDVIVDIDNNGTQDDALVFEYAKVNPLSCDNSASYPTGNFNTFNDKGIVNSTAFAWLSSGPAGPCGDATFDANHMSLADWKSTGIAGISGSTRVLRLEIEVDNWIQSSEAYIDDLLVNGI